MRSSRAIQIITAHAALIVKVATTIQNSDLLPDLQHVLKVSEENGWVDLVAAIRRILNGERELAGLVVGLDEEDSTIIEAILRGIQNPETLPDPNAQPDASMAAPGLAAMIMDATRGNAQSLELLANMAEQMTGAGGGGSPVLRAQPSTVAPPDVICTPGGGASRPTAAIASPPGSNKVTTPVAVVALVVSSPTGSASTIPFRRPSSDTAAMTGTTTGASLTPITEIVAFAESVPPWPSETV